MSKDGCETQSDGEVSHVLVGGVVHSVIQRAQSRTRLLSFHTRSLNVVMHSDCNPCSCPLACCKPASYYERRHFSASPTAKNSALREGPAAHPAPPLLPRSCMPFFRKLCSRLPFPRLVDAQLGVRGSCVRRGDVQTYRSPAGNLVAVQETYLEDHGT